MSNQPKPVAFDIPNTEHIVFTNSENFYRAVKKSVPLSGMKQLRIITYNIGASDWAADKFNDIMGKFAAMFETVHVLVGRNPMHAMNATFDALMLHCMAKHPNVEFRLQPKQHAKIVHCGFDDCSRAWVGSLNLCVSELHDIMVEIRDPRTRLELYTYFKRNWDLASKPVYGSNPRPTLKSLFAPPPHVKKLP
jgi:hypothetical protein